MYSEDKRKEGGAVSKILGTGCDWLLQQLGLVLLDKRQHHLIGDA